MDTKIMGARDLAFLLSEGAGSISRDEVTIKSGAGKLAPGTLLAQLTADKKYVAAADGTADGSQTAKAVLAYAVDATSADAQAVVIARDAEVKTPMLIYGATIDDDTKKAAALAQLAAAHIIAR